MSDTLQEQEDYVTCKEGGRPHPRTAYCNHVTEQPASAGTEPESMAAQFAELRRLVREQQEQNKRLVEALRAMREQFYQHTCKLHGPMVCDKCEALNLADAALNEHERGGGA